MVFASIGEDIFPPECYSLMKVVFICQYNISRKINGTQYYFLRYVEYPDNLMWKLCWYLGKQGTFHLMC